MAASLDTSALRARLVRTSRATPPEPAPVAAPELSCGHRGPANRPCAVCATFAAAPDDAPF